MKTSIKYSLLLVILAVLPTISLAHTETDAGGIVAGLTHPLRGIDHFLAMVSVGVLSALIGHKHIWIVPLTFLCSMVAGALFGILHVMLHHGEIWIAVSVVALGASIAIAHKGVPLYIVYCFICLFGIFHGYAHGVEMPNSASPAFYSFGFLISTSTLHLIGVGIGELAVHKKQFLGSLKMAGGGISLVGVWLLAQAIWVCR